MPFDCIIPFMIRKYKTQEKLRKTTEKTNVEISLQDKIVIQVLFAHSKTDSLARPVAVLSLACTLANSFYNKKI